MVKDMIGTTGYIYDDNDDMAAVIDAVLKGLGSGAEPTKDEDDEWIDRAGHHDIEDALKYMMPKEQAVIRKFFLEDKTLLDISIELNISMELLGGYIKSAEAQIKIWM